MLLPPSIFEVTIIRLPVLSFIFLNIFEDNLPLFQKYYWEREVIEASDSPMVKQRILTILGH